MKAFVSSSNKKRIIQYDNGNAYGLNDKFLFIVPFYGTLDCLEPVINSMATSIYYYRDIGYIGQNAHIFILIDF